MLISQVEPDSLHIFTNTFAAVFGAIILISILMPWFLLPVFLVTILYFNAGAFYRASARELKARASSCWIVSQTYIFVLAAR
jgi:hypothetical protein